ncbi:MAG: hypothetical protein ACD_60C00072G0001 [uncultured bacterium]|nr:MAG: hypothetical protein ACD_60C00072G0001 [uncultured bacterium]
MQLNIISYDDLVGSNNVIAIQSLEDALFQKGIVGIRDVPQFASKTRQFIESARLFSKLPETIKQHYAPDWDAGETEGYELGAEWFKNQQGVWQIDDKKASFYANVPDHSHNKWPAEMDLRTPYLELGGLIFSVGKLLLDLIGLNDAMGLQHKHLKGYGRLLHYHKGNDVNNADMDWCGAHFDHGVFTGLIPAYYFQEDKEIDEPSDAGLYIVPTNGHNFEKILVPDKSTLLFQVGEFGQLISNDKIMATKHTVKKAQGAIERFTFALFYSADDNTVIRSCSRLIKDTRYSENQFSDGSINYGKWQDASFARYRAK